jgi:hemoglobin
LQRDWMCEILATEAYMTTASLYERIGGEAAITAAVDLFYEKVLADDLTRPMFAGLDMQAQIKKQMAFMTVAFGGPDMYKGRDLRAAHATLVKEKGLTDAHFDAVAGHLKATLIELQVPSNLIDEALSIVAGTRNEVLGK